MKKTTQELNRTTKMVFDLYNRPEWPPEVPYVEGHMPSPVEQSHADACDVNYIVKRFSQDGVLESRLLGAGSYGDFTNITSYDEAVLAVKAAEEEFLKIPVEIRKQFDHDPGRFIQFCSDPANADELVKMGLATKTDKQINEELEVLKEMRDELKASKKRTPGSESQE